MTPGFLPPGRLRPMARLAALVVAALAAACGDPADDPKPTADTTSTTDTAGKDSQASSDVFVNNWVQGYSARLTFHGGPSNGKVVQLERDLYYDPQTCSPFFLFGSSHMTWPAVQFGMQDHTQQVVGKTLSPLDLQLHFGTLVESANDPVQTGKAGVYPFACGAPFVQVDFQNARYKSTCPGLPGQIEVTDWSAQKGGRFAGRFAGRLQFYKQPSGAVNDCSGTAATSCDKTDMWVDVEGHFGFELPAPDCKEP